MDSSTPNSEVMERYVESLQQNDWQAATTFWAEDVLLHFPGRNPFSGDFLGKEAFLEHYGRLCTELGGTTELAPRSTGCSSVPRAGGRFSQGAGGACRAHHGVRASKCV